MRGPETPRNPSWLPFFIVAVHLAISWSSLVSRSGTKRAAVAAAPAGAMLKRSVVGIAKTVPDAPPPGPHTTRWTAPWEHVHAQWPFKWGV